MRRLRGLAAPMAMVAVVLIQFAPVLAGRVYRFEDIGGYFEPLWTAAVRQAAAGQLPLWDRGAWSGQLIVADPQAGIFYPPNWLALALPVLRAYALLALLHAEWAALGMYLLCRRRGRSPGAAACAGVALGAGAFVVMQLRHLPFVAATAWTPWVVIAGLRVIDRGDVRALVGLGLASGMWLLTGGVSMIYYASWFVAGLWAVPLLARPGAARWRSGGLLLLGAACGLLLAAPMLLPAAAHAPESPRALGADYHFASRFAWSHYGYVVTLFLPHVFGDDAAGGWRGGGTQWELAGYYAGVIPFLAALYWLLRGDRAQRNERIVLALLCLFAIGLAREGSIWHRAAYRLLPLLAATRCPARALYVFTFVVPLLGADGIDAIAARWAPPRAGRLVALALLLVSFDLLWTFRHWNPSLTAAAAARQARPDGLAFLRGQPEERYINGVHVDHALHNSGLLWGLENASGYHSLPNWRYLHYLWIVNHGAPYPTPQLHDDLSAQGIWRFASPLVDAAAIRFLLADRAPDGSGWELRFRGGDGLSVWENREALPRARVVRRLRVVSSPAAAAAAIAAPTFDPTREVVLEGAPAIAPQGEDVAAGGLVTHPTPSSTEVVLRLERPGVLVVAEPFHALVRAEVDGAPAPLLAANYAFRAVALPAGSHHVRFAVDSAPVRRGILLAATGLGLLLLVTVAATWRRRRAR